jgi:hypothetical protein
LRSILGPTERFPRVVVAAEPSRVVSSYGTSPDPIIAALKVGGWLVVWLVRLVGAGESGLLCLVAWAAVLSLVAIRRYVAI